MSISFLNRKRWDGTHLRLLDELLMVESLKFLSDMFSSFSLCNYKSEITINNFAPGLLHPVHVSPEKKETYQTKSSEVPPKKFLGYLIYEERLRELELFIMEKRRLEGISTVYINTRREGLERTEFGSFQWCSVTGSEEMDTD